MPTKTDHQSSHAKTGAGRMDPSELLPSLQALLAALADIDFAHESDIETVRNSSAGEWLKQTVIGRLQARHQERRASYVQQLERLEKQILTRAA
jgi:hypothetical protein